MDELLQLTIGFWDRTEDGEEAWVELPFHVTRFSTDCECIAKARLWDRGYLGTFSVFYAGNIVLDRGGQWYANHFPEKDSK